MKKITLIVVFALLALGLFTGVAAAQGAQPPRAAQGPLHEYFEQALANELGLTLAEVEAQFAAGKTLWQIALDNGIAEAELPVFMQEVHKVALEAAVADGVITQERADWMLARMAGNGYGYGTGLCPMGAERSQSFGSGYGMGMRGNRWQQTNP